MSPKVYEHKTLSYQGKTIFGKILMGEFKRIDKYFQEDEACFMFIDQGDFLLRTPETTLHFTQGDGMLAKCGNYFFEQRIEEDRPENKTALISAYFYPSIIRTLFNEDVLKGTKRTNYDASKVKVDKLLLNFKDNINFLLDNPEVADEELILTKLKEFLILLAKAGSIPSINNFVSSLFKPVEYDFKRIIEKNILSSLSLDEFAFLCGMSLASFKRKFKEIYAESPRKYISNKKMEKAAQLLCSKENKSYRFRISDIAYDCGFESIKTFNRNFKTYFGKSPKEYREQLS